MTSGLNWIKCATHNITAKQTTATAITALFSRGVMRLSIEMSLARPTFPSERHQSREIVSVGVELGSAVEA